MIKKVVVEVSSAQSEQVKDQILSVIKAVAPNGNNAAEVIRDANGKVIRVAVNLPDTAAENARDAVNGNAGVPFVTVTELPIGTIGMDGTEESKDALVAYLTGLNNNSSLYLNVPVDYLGTAMQLQHPEHTSIWNTPNFNGLSINKYGNIANMPIFKVEMRIRIPEFGTEGLQQMAKVVINSDIGTSSIIIRTVGMADGIPKILHYSTDWDGAEIEAVADGEYHIYTIEHNGLNSICSVDGVVKKTVLIDTNVKGDRLSISLQGPYNPAVAPAINHDIEYLRWTTPIV